MQVSWQRVRVASALATSGEEWVRMLDTHNSGTLHMLCLGCRKQPEAGRDVVLHLLLCWGTWLPALAGVGSPAADGWLLAGSYNNQYMVVDHKLFKPGHPLQPGTLWVAEQVPHLVAAGDQTQALAWGYWPSYNVPFYPEVRLGRGGAAPALQGLRFRPVRRRRWPGADQAALARPAADAGLTSWAARAARVSSASCPQARAACRCTQGRASLALTRPWSSGGPPGSAPGAGSATSWRPEPSCSGVTRPAWPAWPTCSASCAATTTSMTR